MKGSEDRRLEPAPTRGPAGRTRGSAHVGGSSCSRPGRSRRCREDRRLEPAPSMNAVHPMGMKSMEAFIPIYSRPLTKPQVTRRSPAGAGSYKGPCGKDARISPCRRELLLPTRTQPKVTRRSPAGAGSYSRPLTKSQVTRRSPAGAGSYKESTYPQKKPTTTDPSGGVLSGKTQRAIPPRPRPDQRLNSGQTDDVLAFHTSCGSLSFIASSRSRILPGRL